MGDKTTEGKEQVRNRINKKELKIVCAIQRQCLSSLNYNRKKSLLVSATVLNTVSTVKAVSNTGNCIVSELVGEADYTGWYWRRSDGFAAVERGREH